eukprot:5767883-Prymnesium_polylepis.1
MSAWGADEGEGEAFEEDFPTAAGGVPSTNGAADDDFLKRLGKPGLSHMKKGEAQSASGRMLQHHHHHHGWRVLQHHHHHQHNLHGHEHHEHHGHHLGVMKAEEQGHASAVKQQRFIKIKFDDPDEGTHDYEAYSWSKLTVPGGGHVGDVMVGDRIRHTTRGDGVVVALESKQHHTKRPRPAITRAHQHHVKDGPKEGESLVGIAPENIEDPPADPSAKMSAKATPAPPAKTAPAPPAKRYAAGRKVVALRGKKRQGASTKPDYWHKVRELIVENRARKARRPASNSKTRLEDPPARTPNLGPCSPITNRPTNYPTSQPTVPRRQAERGILEVFLRSGSELPAADKNGKSDPYVVVSIGKQEKSSAVCKKTLNPVWDQHICMFGTLGHLVRQSLKLRVKDWDKKGKDDHLGETTVSLFTFLQSNHEEYNEPIYRKGAQQGALQFGLAWHPAETKLPEDGGLRRRERGFLAFLLKSGQGLPAADKNGTSD